MGLGVIDILKLAGLTLTPHCRFVRHQDDRYPVEELRRRDWLELYQSYQGRPVFHKVNQLVSFYGLPGTRVAFYGVYKVLGYRPAPEGTVIAECPWFEKWQQEARFFYDLECDSRFDELRDRLVIDW
jgi:hypothetical protein